MQKYQSLCEVLGMVSLYPLIGTKQRTNESSHIGASSKVLYKVEIKKCVHYNNFSYALATRADL